MNVKEKERIISLYNSEDDITSLIIKPGYKVGSTTKEKLNSGIYSELDD